MWQTKYVLAGPKIWEWDLIFGRASTAVKGIFSPGVRSQFSIQKKKKNEQTRSPVCSCPESKVESGKKERERNSRFKVKGFCTCKSINSNGTEKNSKTPKRYGTAAGMKI